MFEATDHISPSDGMSSNKEMNAGAHSANFLLLPGPGAQAYGMMLSTVCVGLPTLITQT